MLTKMATLRFYAKGPELVKLQIRKANVEAFPPPLSGFLFVCLGGRGVVVLVFDPASLVCS